MFKVKNLFSLKIFLYPTIGVIAYSAYCYYVQQFQKHSKSSEEIKHLSKILRLIQQTKSIRDITSAYSEACKKLDVYLTDPYHKNGKIIDSNNEVSGKGSWALPYSGYKLFRLNKYNLQEEKRNGVFMLGLWMNLQEYRFSKIQNQDRFMDLIKQIRSYRGKKCSEYAEMKSSDLNNYSFHAYEECISKTNEYYVDLSRNIDFVEKFIKHQKQ